jgi:hypothetical protein
VVGWGRWRLDCDRMGRILLGSDLVGRAMWRHRGQLMRRNREDRKVMVECIISAIEVGDNIGITVVVMQ